MTKENPLRITLVDDDADDRLLFKKVIDEIPIHTTLTLLKNGHELVDYLQPESRLLPNLIFLDLNMPGKSGMECLEEIRNNPDFNDIAIAIYSAFSAEKVIEQTFVTGANIYITKPATMSDLKTAMEKVLQINWQYCNANFDRDTFLFRI